MSLVPSTDNLLLPRISFLPKAFIISQQKQKQTKKKEKKKEKKHRPSPQHHLGWVVQLGQIEASHSLLLYKRGRELASDPGHIIGFLAKAKGQGTGTGTGDIYASTLCSELT